MIEKLYTVEEVAELASVTGRTIRNYLKSGRLVGRKIGGQWRFPESEVQRLLTGAEDHSSLEMDVVSNDVQQDPQSQDTERSFPEYDKEQAIEATAPVFQQPYVAPAPLPQPPVAGFVAPPLQTQALPNNVSHEMPYSEPEIGMAEEYVLARSMHTNSEMASTAATSQAVSLGQAAAGVSVPLDGLHQQPQEALPAMAQESVTPTAQTPPQAQSATAPVSSEKIPEKTSDMSSVSAAPAAPFSSAAYLPYGSYGSVVSPVNYQTYAAPVAYPVYPNLATYHPFLYGQGIPAFSGSYFSPEMPMQEPGQEARLEQKSENRSYEMKKEEIDADLYNASIPRGHIAPTDREEEAGYRNLSEVGQRVDKFIAEVHDCSYGPRACMVLDRYQTLEAAKHTSEKLGEMAYQESDEDFSCQSFVEYDERFNIARYTLFGSSHFLYQSLQILG